MTGPLLEVRDLEKHFVIGEGWLQRQAARLRAVDGVSFAIGAGETLGLVGESGCGKSTLGRLLLRLIEPSGGTIRFEGVDVTTLDRAGLRRQRRAMQIIFQDPYGALDPRMSVGDIVGEPLAIHAVPRAEIPRRVAETLELVGLARGHAGRYPHEFSGGQRQRIGIARALALRPRFIVCDEPVSALDVSVQAQIVNLLQDLQAELRLTYLFIAHDLAVVKHISDRVAVMYLGQIVEIADKRTIYARPLHPYTQALIAAVPSTRPRGRRRERLAGEIPSALHPPAGCRFHTRCPYVMDVCREQPPRMVAATPGHEVACHLVAGS
ncbi:MAG: ATP-binding cassette domain-containing protein [Acidisphaera sp.]|nr:ATP-binding cassette domain-containing protein [Acidisphaera sp.]